MELDCICLSACSSQEERIVLKSLIRLIKRQRIENARDTGMTQLLSNLTAEWHTSLKQHVLECTPRLMTNAPSLPPRCCSCKVGQRSLPWRNPSCRLMMTRFTSCKPSKDIVACTANIMSCNGQAK